MTHDEEGNRYFTGIYTGLYRTNRRLVETGRNDDVIGEAHADGYNHIGDLTYYDGRLYLPLECYYPPAGNTCKTGAIGVADPVTLTMRYYVELDPAEIQKAMWAEVSPNGRLLWTSSGDDLLAYRVRDIRRTNARPAGGPINAVRRLAGAVPPSGITGATFICGRLFLAGQAQGPEQVWSIDLSTGSARLEIATEYVGESEGLDDDYGLTNAQDAIKGKLHWMVQPYNQEGPPTNGVDHGVLYNYKRVRRTAR